MKGGVILFVKISSTAILILLLIHYIYIYSHIENRIMLNLEKREFWGKYGDLEIMRHWQEFSEFERAEIQGMKYEGEKVVDYLMIH